MALGGRRVRRYGGRPHILLPLRTSQHSNLTHTLSCWYCDYKISIFNDLLFSFGHKHSRFLRFWFSIGIGFSFAALFGVTLILLWNSVSTLLYLYNGNVGFSDGILFGYLSSPSVLKVPRLGMSLFDGGNIIFSTLISVAVHELGHAISAASEGVQIEYIAIFLAVLFPGALVAFNYDTLQSLPKSTILRIYCAGIWHNAVCCLVCALALLILPSVLSPFYIHGANPMVMDVKPTSPLFGYLTPGDVIVSVDGVQVHNPKEWTNLMVLMNDLALQTSDHSKDSTVSQEVTNGKGYCISSSFLQNKKNAELVDDQSVCPDELTAFSTVPCSNLSGDTRKEKRHCLSARDVVQLQKCGSGWLTNSTNRSSCECSMDETCMEPALLPGLIWVEVAYIRPYSNKCLRSLRNSSENLMSPHFGGTKCGATFVFIGDALPMANSIELTAYQPHSVFSLGLSLPNKLEKILACTFHVSLTLALLNSLPVYFLDGESILEEILGYITILSPRKRAYVQRVCLLGGSLLSVLSFFKIFLFHLFVA